MNEKIKGIQLRIKILIRVRKGRVETTIDFTERYNFWLSSPNYDRGTSNSETKPTPDINPVSGTEDRNFPKNHQF